MSNQKLTRREKRVKAKRQKQMQSIGIMIIGVLIIVAGIVIVSVSGPRVSKGPGETYANDVGNAIGDPKAPVVIEEYFSFSCSHCRNFAVDNFPLLYEEYIQTGEVYYISRAYSNPNDAVGIASQAALCAGDQGKYFEMHDIIFANFSAYGYRADQLKSMANAIDLDMDQYETCMADGVHVSTIEDHLVLAGSVGVDSTPNFVINGQLAIVGNNEYSYFQSQIELAKGSTQQ
jgi:protein-disulfide isomerase